MPVPPWPTAGTPVFAWGSRCSTLGLNRSTLRATPGAARLPRAAPLRISPNASHPARIKDSGRSCRYCLARLPTARQHGRSRLCAARQEQSEGSLQMFPHSGPAPDMSRQKGHRFTPQINGFDRRIAINNPSRKFCAVRGIFCIRNIFCIECPGLEYCIKQIAGFIFESWYMFKHESVTKGGCFASHSGRSSCQLCSPQI